MTIRLPRKPWIVGHRGAAADAPENTPASLRLALEQGADMVEIDVQLTTDGDLVVQHDPIRPEQIGISSLEDLLAALPAGFPLNIELKSEHASNPRFAAAFVERIAARPQVLVSSFNWPLLEEVRALAPSLPLAPLAAASTGSPDALRRIRSVAEDLAAWSIHVSAEAAESTLRGLATGPRPVLCFTVNDPTRAKELFRMGVSGVFTDSPGRLRLALGLSPGPQFH